MLELLRSGFTVRRSKFLSYSNLCNLRNLPIVYHASNPQMTQITQMIETLNAER